MGSVRCTGTRAVCCVRGTTSTSAHQREYCLFPPSTFHTFVPQASPEILSEVQMLTLNAQAEAQHVSAVIDNLSAKEALPDAIVRTWAELRNNRGTVLMHQAFRPRLARQAPGWRRLLSVALHKSFSTVNRARTRKMNFSARCVLFHKRKLNIVILKLKSHAISASCVIPSPSLPAPLTRVCCVHGFGLPKSSLRNR
eukprot:6198138-Pleurochrysis_carterae.AAC.1